jgi:hypothetical protein
MLSPVRWPFGVPLLTLFIAPALAHAQPFGSTDTEFRVNAYTTYNETGPAAAADGNGKFLAVWSAENLDGNGSGIFARRLDDRGTPLGTDFQVNSYTSDTQTAAAVAALGNGGFVVVWQSGGATDQEDGSLTGLYARRMDEAGFLGAAFRVNVYTTGAQSAPSIASDASGNFVVVWQDTFATTLAHAFGVTGQRFSSSGVRVGPPFRVNTFSTNSHRQPAVAESSTGVFVVVWKDVSSSSDVFGQRFASTGLPSGTSFLVSAGHSVDSSDPIAAAWGPNGFIVAWQKNGAGTQNIFARRYSSTGASQGGEFQVDTAGSYASEPSVAFDATGSFLVSWTAADGDLGGVFARRFDSTGAGNGVEFRVNTYTTSAQGTSRVVESSKGRYLLVWESNPEDGDGSGIFAQRDCQTIAGDPNGDGTIDVADVFYLINTLFAGGPAPVRSGDANGDGTTDIADVFFLINYLFAGGAVPACA